MTQKSREILRFDPTMTEGEPDDITNDVLRDIFGSRKTQRKTGIRAVRNEFIESKGDFKSAPAPEGDTYQLIPPSLTSERQRDVWFVSGRSGSGKSYISAELLAMYRKSGQKVFIFTDIPDPKFGDAKYLDIHTFVGISTTFEEQKQTYEEAKIKFKHRKKMLDDDEDKIALEIELSRLKPDPALKKRKELKFSQDDINKIFQNSVVLFDDYENNTDLELISFLRDTLLTKGRHSHTSLIICNHLTNFGSEARLIMAEATNFILFAKSTPQSRSYFLKTYLDYEKSHIRMIKSALKHSRWVSIDRELDVNISQKTAWVYHSV